MWEDGYERASRRTFAHPSWNAQRNHGARSPRCCTGEERRGKHLLSRRQSVSEWLERKRVFSLYAEMRSSPEARAASDFNRGPIYRSDAFREFFTTLNYAAQTARNWHNNRYDRNDRLWPCECNARGIRNAVHGLLM